MLNPPKWLWSYEKHIFQVHLGPAARSAAGSNYTAADLRRCDLPTYVASHTPSIPEFLGLIL